MMLITNHSLKLEDRGIDQTEAKSDHASIGNPAKAANNHMVLRNVERLELA